MLHTRKGSVQGYNAQAVSTLEQVIVAAELTHHASDLQQLQPMLADAGYWTIANLTELPGAPELLIPPAKHGRQAKPRKEASRRRPEVTGSAPR